MGTSSDELLEQEGAGGVSHGMIVALVCLVLTWFLGALKKLGFIGSASGSSSGDSTDASNAGRMEKFKAMMRSEMWRENGELGGGVGNSTGGQDAKGKQLGLSDLDAVSRVRLGLVGVCGLGITSAISESYGHVAAALWLSVGITACKMTYDKAAAAPPSSDGATGAPAADADGEATPTTRTTRLPVTVITGFLGSGKCVEIPPY